MEALFIGQAYIDVTFLTEEIPTGDEKARWWERSVAVWPNYADYQTKTTREIPVFVLTPLAADE